MNLNKTAKEMKESKYPNSMLFAKSQMDTQAFKKDIRIWLKRISHNANTLPELLWKEGEQSNQLMIRKQNKEDLELLRYKISRTTQTLFSYEEDDCVSFKMDQIHDYFGKWD